MERSVMVYGSLNEAATIVRRCLWIGWTWFWSAVGLFIISVGIFDQGWRVPVAGVLGMVALVALIRIGVIASSDLRGVATRPL
jgi:hypothetical protein